LAQMEKPEWSAQFFRLSTNVRLLPPAGRIIPARSVRSRTLVYFSEAALQS
jgi:hypothetical protein